MAIAADLWHRDSVPAGFTDPYGRTLVELADPGVVGRVDDYLVAVLAGHPEGHYEIKREQTAWRDPAPDATVRIDVAVADAADGRFVPGLAVYVAAERDGRTCAAARCPFHWHPVLHRYARNLRLPPGRFDLIVRIVIPEFARDDRTAGRRYTEPAVLRFPAVEMASNAVLRGKDF